MHTSQVKSLSHHLLRYRILALFFLLFLPLTGTAANSYIKIISQPGDPVGGGSTATFYSVSESPYITQRYLGFAAASYSFNFNTSLDAFPIGVYLKSLHYPADGNGSTSLKIYGNGGSCSDNTGRFIIHDLEFNNGTLTRAAIDFEQYCGNSFSALYGFIRLNSDLPITDSDTDSVYDIMDNCLTTANSNQEDTDIDGIGDACDPAKGLTFIYLDSEKGEWIGQGQSTMLTPNNSNIVMSRSINTGYIELTAAGYTFKFEAPLAKSLTPGTYEGAVDYLYNKEMEPGMSISGPMRGCSGINGRFLIQEISRDENSLVKNLAMEFEQRCYASPALHGVIRFNAENTDAGIFDIDNDGILFNEDNCPDIGNSAQTDTDQDSTGDACDAFPQDSQEFIDTDADDIGNNSDPDDDNDGIIDTEDVFPLDPDETTDTDGDNIGNNADTDDDNDGIPDIGDNCPLDANPSQEDRDNNEIGDHCDRPYILDFDILGADQNGLAGWAVADAGDFDGDGTNDIVIGIPGRSNVMSLEKVLPAAGRAEVISGQTGETLAFVNGIHRNSLLGFAVAGGGDIDNDGFDDVAVSAPAWIEYAYPYVAILYGPDGTRRGDIRADRIDGYFGYSLALADVNSDSHADIIVGIPMQDNSMLDMPDTGSTRIYSGTRNEILAEFYGETAGAHAGVSVTAAATDETSGLEIIVGAPDDDDISNNLRDAGSISVYRHTSPDSPVAKFFGKSARSYLGAALATGDLDGDGMEEIIAGAPGEDNPARKIKDAGSVVTYRVGNPLELARQYGNTPKARLGTKVASGDINGDSHDDIIASAPREKSSSGTGRKLPRAGSVSIWNGSDFSPMGSTMYGDQRKGLFGSALSACDVDRDGMSDLIIGSAGYEVSPVAPGTKPIRNAGLVTVFSGAELSP